MKMNKIKNTGFLVCVCIALLVSCSYVSADQLEKIWVAKISNNDKSVDLNWDSGLNAPKGTTLKG